MVVKNLKVGEVAIYALLLIVTLVAVILSLILEKEQITETETLAVITDETTLQEDLLTELQVEIIQDPIIEETVVPQIEEPTITRSEIVYKAIPIFEEEEIYEKEVEEEVIIEDEDIEVPLTLIINGHEIVNGINTTLQLKHFRDRNSVRTYIPDGYIRGESLGTLRITGYNPWDAAQNGSAGSSGILSSGVIAKPWYSVAMHNSIPFGTLIEVVGLGIFTVQDRGVKTGKVDVAVNNNNEAYSITGMYEVYILDTIQPEEDIILDTLEEVEDNIVKVLDNIVTKEDDYVEQPEDMA